MKSSVNNVNKNGVTQINTSSSANSSSTSRARSTSTPIGEKSTTTTTIGGTEGELKENDGENKESTMRKIPTPEGMDCHADERDFLADFEKYYNNSYLSDVQLIVADELFYAHRIMLVKSSEVFERMLSKEWNDASKKEVELTEEPGCAKVFPQFLRFLYCNHVLLHADNTLPLLVLADKYNVQPLRTVCLNYAKEYILPQMSSKELFHTWFQYSTKCFHQELTSHCISVLAACFTDVMSGPDWEKDWLELDRDQIIEFLKCNDLQIPNEFELWTAIQRWLMAPNHPERRGTTAGPLLANILPLIRFPFMTADELNTLERAPVVEQHAKMFMPHILTAYKYMAMPLSSRAGVKEFTGLQFLLRDYIDVRWDKRLVIKQIAAVERYQEVPLKFSSRPSAVGVHSWEWELKVHPRGYSTANDDFRVFLSSNVMLDQTRPIEFLWQIVDEKKVVRSAAGKRTFTKTRYTHDLEAEKKIGIEEILADNSPLLVGDNLVIQLTLKPID